MIRKFLLPRGNLPPPHRQACNRPAGYAATKKFLEKLQEKSSTTICAACRKNPTASPKPGARRRSQKSTADTKWHGRPPYAPGPPQQDGPEKSRAPGLRTMPQAARPVDPTGSDDAFHDMLRHMWPPATKRAGSRPVPHAPGQTGGTAEKPAESPSCRAEGQRFPTPRHPAKKVQTQGQARVPKTSRMWRSPQSGRGTGGGPARRCCKSALSRRGQKKAPTPPVNNIS